MPEQTLIIGGGLAGLAAAMALAGRGVPVTLLESRPRLGGRASSFVDRTTGAAIDNCQHVSMGCCTNFRHFCETVGLERHLRRERELYFVGPDNRVNRFAASSWPAPLHLLPAFRKLSYLSRDDLRSLSRGLRDLARTDPSRLNGQTFDRWLHEHGQTPTAIERVWHVVLVSALSETLDRIDVASARKVFVDAFLAHRHGWEVQIPTVPLDDLYGTELTGWLAQHGASVRTGAGVERLVMHDGLVKAAELRNGEQIAADHFILAVPHHRVADLVPEPLAATPGIAGLTQLESAPISSVHLWFDRPVTPLPHAVFVERLSQWMFNRTALQGAGPSSPDGPTTETYYYQVVISASRALDGRPQQEVIAEVVAEFAAVWPETRQATLVHSRLVTEHKAVFSVKPGAERHRPPQQTPVANLQLAGDWTRTGWPATMEGAVRSGYLAAENVLRHLGRPDRVVQPNLPVAFLSRLLFGLG